MADKPHKHGEMDITAQEKAFDGFVRFAVRGAIICIVVLIFVGLVNG
ncbi:MAG: aa3-type cytochrome c oxidase subunit IV [Paracoccaceae bacterium]